MKKSLPRVVPLNPSAQNLANESDLSRERVAILGASGWFGRTAVHLLSANPPPMLLFARSERKIQIQGSTFLVHVWNKDLIRDFRPSIVLDFGANTINMATKASLQDQRDASAQVLGRLKFVSTLRGLKALVGTSSGAAQHLTPRGDISEFAMEYARHKRDLEEQLLNFRTIGGLSTILLRPWSVSGGHVVHPAHYALSSFVLSASKSRKISVLATGLTFRRYCAVEELLAITFHKIRRPSNDFTVESGGQKIEILDLASEVANHFPGTRVSVSDNRMDDPDLYFSDNSRWESSVQASGLTPLPLERQIGNVVQALAPR